MSSLLINEIFYSLQGEGRWMGRPNVFLRTAGCNLRCTYCDTTYAYEQGTIQTIDQIIKTIAYYDCSRICITGGEPLIQDHLLMLLKTLQDQSYLMCIETNGTHSIQPLLSLDHLFVSLDVKCPSSKMHENTDFSNLSLIRARDQLKFIIGHRKDYEYAKKIIDNYQLDCAIYFQPVWGFSPQLLSSWMLEDSLDVTLGIQLHKYLWGEKTSH